MTALKKFPASSNNFSGAAVPPDRAAPPARLRRAGRLRWPQAKMMRLVSLGLAIDTFGAGRPAARVADVTGETPQSAGNHLRAQGGINGAALIALLGGFPTLQRHAFEVIQNYARDPEILDRKLAELEAHWRGLRSGGGEEQS